MNNRASFPRRRRLMWAHTQRYFALKCGDVVFTPIGMDHLCEQSFDRREELRHRIYRTVARYLPARRLKDSDEGCLA